MLKMKDQLNQILSKHTGRPMEQIEKDTDRTTSCRRRSARSTGWWTKSSTSGVEVD